MDDNLEITLTVPLTKEGERLNKDEKLTLTMNFRYLSKYRRKQVSLETRKSRSTLESPPTIDRNLENTEIGLHSYTS